jgi:diguanylate cyclase (GGDEF)-like protein/PAS domain S-box-containing protein
MDADRELLALLLDRLPDAVVLIDTEARVVWANEATERLFGVPMAAARGLSGLDFIHPDDLELATLSICSLRDKDLGTPHELRVRTPQGWRLVEVIGTSIPMGRATTILMSLRDLTERRDSAESELRDTLSLLEATLDATADGVLVVDRENHVTSFNRRFVEMFGIPTELLTSRDDEGAIAFVLEQLLDPRAFVTKIHELYSQPTTKSHDTLEFKDGRVFERYSSPQRLGDAIVGRVWSFHDVTRRKRLEEELAQQALHDSLTGLANQALFRDRVTHALERIKWPKQRVAVLFMDLDSFKTVNDSLGHAAGDQLLITVGQRLQTCLRAADTAARLGGDEFAVLLENVTEDEAAAVAKRIIESLGPPIVVDAVNEVVTSVSVGIALSDENVDTQQLLRNADLAMYTAKGRGRGRQALFEEGMHAAAMERLELETDLRHACERGELVVVYQPIVDLRTGWIVAVEALARWHHPRRGLLNPESFIALAEETGMIDEIGEHVLAVASLQVCEWNRRPPVGGRKLDLSVNLSPRQLLDPDLPAQVCAALERSALAPEQLILEITESAMGQDVEAASCNADALHDLGVGLAVDDFGTGYSSLSHLQRFPIDIVKIDRSFVIVVDGDAEESALANAIVRLAHTLGLSVIAEGVETPAQARRLHSIGCRLAQGFYFAEPLDGAALYRLLERGPMMHPGARLVCER